jgi:hypothetical protein
LTATARARLGVLALLVGCLSACLSVPAPDATLDAPGDLSFGTARISAQTDGEDTMIITVDNDSRAPVGVAVEVPPVVIAMRTTVERTVTGYTEQTVCEGEVCRVVRVPVYADVSGETAVYADLEISSKSLSIEAGGTARVTLRLRNRGDARTPYVVSARLTVDDGEAVRVARVDFRFGA